MSRKGEAIYKRKDGRYEARFIKDYTNNKANYMYIYGKTYTEAKKKRQKAIENIKETNHNINNRTYNDIFDLFIKNKKNVIKESSISTYTLLINNHLRPIFGKYNINSINEKFINNFIANKLNNYSTTVVHDIATLLKQILKLNNISINFYIPPKRKNTIDVLTETEVNKLKKYCLNFNSRISFGIVFALYTGVRIGELCALKKSDFNIIDKQVVINKTLLRINNINNNGNKTKIISSSAKTENSKRIIPLAEVLIPYLQKYLGSIKDNEYLLTGTYKYIEPRVYYNKYLKILNTLKIKKHNFHSLRHTFATYAVSKNMDIKALSEILGHSNISITLSLYVHPSMNYKRDCINNIFN